MGKTVKSCAIISGAPFNDYDFIKQQVLPTDFVICADSGYQTALAAGIVPDLIVGDFDSSPNQNVAKTIVLPTQKDDTDTLFAVNQALKLGYRSIRIFAALGARLDHTYANILCLAHINAMGAFGTLIDPNAQVLFLDSASMAITKNDKKYLSLFAFAGDAHGVSITGVKYPLNNHHLKAADQLGVSNEITAAEAVVSVKNGKLLIFLTND